MELKAAVGSMLSSLGSVFKSSHTWQYNEHQDQRSCTVCGRREEFVLDIVSTNWDMLEPGDKSAHKVAPAGARRPADTDVFAAEPAIRSPESA